MGPHAFEYDNLNISTSIYVEQVPGSMSKVRSGTFSVIYELLPSVSIKDMELEPMMRRFRTSKPLSMADLRPSREASLSYQFQTLINIVECLIKYSPNFEKYANNPKLQHKARRRLPDGHKTRYYPLRCTTIEEASITGNILHHDDVYCVQMKRDPTSLNQSAIPSINDQLTNSRIRSIQELRGRDLTAWAWREIFTLGFGVFHFLMNLIWALLHVHYGAINISGSLSHFFALLEKVRLAGEHPDFHTLLVALTQILDGLILNAWRQEIALDGHDSLDSFAATDPSPEELLVYSRRILEKYATPTEKPEPVYKKSEPTKSRKRKASEDSASDTESSEADCSPTSKQARNDTDVIYENAVLLVRDLLYMIELVKATADGDFGRIEDILPDLACVFRAAGCNKYSTEILHWLYQIKSVWTPEFANIMRDAMLVNPSGRKGHAMGTDMHIEHLIGYQKVCARSIDYFPFSFVQLYWQKESLHCERDPCKLGSSWRYFSSDKPSSNHQNSSFPLDAIWLPGLDTQTIQSRQSSC